MIMNLADKQVGILDWAHKVASVSHRGFEDAAGTCLDLGVQHLGLPFGVVSSIHRNVFRVDKVVGRPPGLQVDDEWSVEETPCYPVITGEGVFHSEDLSLNDSGAATEYVQAKGVRAFISAPIWVNQAVQGTLSFYSDQPGSGFSSQDVEAIEIAAFGLGRHLEFEHFKNIRELLNIQLKEALEDVKALHGLLPICACCKKIRDVDGLWVKFEEYVAKHSLAQLSHGLCKPCVKELYGFDPDEVDEENCKCDG